MLLGYSAKILADSLSPSGVRLTTFELTFPRFILPEFNTHRVFSRNSASSRAIPVVKQMLKVLESPFVPSSFGINEPGMQASAFLSGTAHGEAVQAWKRARGRAVWSALEELFGVPETTKLLGENYWHEFDPFESEESRKKVADGLREFELYIKAKHDARQEQTRYLNVHKQTANRLMEQFTWHTVIVTATEWDNFWALRDNAAAQPEIQTIARLAKKLYLSSEPTPIEYGQWHLPLILTDEVPLIANDVKYWLMVSAGRCARISYETHDGLRDPSKDVELCKKLTDGGHMSPLEHLATPMEPIQTVDKIKQQWSGNFRGWKQYRKFFPHEDNFGAREG